MDVVTADGHSIRVDDQQNSDLLFAAKGAGPGMITGDLQLSFVLIVIRFSCRGNKIPLEGSQGLPGYAILNFHLSYLKIRGGNGLDNQDKS